MRRLGLFFSFIGRETSVWFLFSGFGSVALSLVDSAIAVFIQAFLKSMGLIQIPVTFGPLGQLDFSPTFLVFAMVGVATLRAGGQLIVNVSATYANERMNFRLRRLAAFDMLLRTRGEAVIASRINTLLGELFPKASSFCFVVAQFLSNLIQITVILSLIFTLAWKEALVGLAGFGLVGIVVLLLNRKVASIATNIPNEYLALARGVERIARNLLLIRVMDLRGEEHRHLVGSAKRYQDHSVGMAWVASTSAVLTPLLGIVLLVAIVVLSRSQFLTPVPVLLSFLYLFVRLSQCMGSTVTYLGSLVQLFPQFKLAHQYFLGFDPAERRQAFSPAGRAAPTPAATRTQAGVPDWCPLSLNAENLTYRYRGNDADTLSRWNLKLGVGAQLAIVGPSGSGKSTLLALIMGVLHPTSGSLWWADAEGRPRPTDAIRFGYVGAEPFLIAGSVLDNLRYGLRWEPSPSEFTGILKALRMDGWLASRPEGLSYLLNENGDGLSAGQKQRLCLARALLARPEVLVLDEATANLDADTEREISTVLAEYKNKTTVLIVSHRDGILVHADERIHLGGAD
ncbi:MAG: ABC transporter ATP-binding protein [Spirochaetes bacterium]|nr:ABC transporter ATP-binding protein [Spirochaetota bacterium]